MPGGTSREPAVLLRLAASPEEPLLFSSRSCRDLLSSGRRVRKEGAGHGLRDGMPRSRAGMAVYAVRQTVLPRKRPAPAIRMFTAGTRRGAWPRAHSARHVKQEFHSRELGRGDICDGERAAAYRQPATESCQSSPQKKLRALTQQTLPREDGACGKASANVLLFCLCMRDDVEQTVDVPSESPPPFACDFRASRGPTHEFYLDRFEEPLPRPPNHSTNTTWTSISRSELVHVRLGGNARVFLATVVQI